MNGLKGEDKHQGDLRDSNGGTFGTAVGEQNLPEGLEHRKGPLNKSSGRRKPDDRQ